MVIKRNMCFLIIGFFLVFGSCVTRKKTTYLQEKEEAVYPLKTEAPVEYKIQPNDNLYIKVITPDPTWSQIYNTMPVASYSLTTNEEGANLISYTVYEDGSIDFPYVGAIKVAGLTVREIRDVVEKRLLEYVKDASILVKLVNNYVSLIGDVERPGKYLIYKDRMTVFQALALAGDLGDYSNRRKVQIIRQTPDGPFVAEFDLTNKKILQSELYYVMPNDVIYAKPMKGKFFQMSGFPYTIILSAVTTLLLIYNIFQ